MVTAVTPFVRSMDSPAKKMQYHSGDFYCNPDNFMLYYQYRIFNR